MTIAVGPIVGSTRVVVLGPGDHVVRGSQAEYRHFGVSVVVRQDILAALTEVVHDPNAMLVVAADVPCETLRDVLDLAIATCRSSVLLGVTPLTETSAISMAMRAGVRATVDLPISAERLARSLRSLPSADTGSGPIAVGALTVDRARHRLEWGGVSIDLTPREFDVVAELASHYPGVVRLEDLARDYRGSAADPAAAVRVVITHVRSRISEVAGPAGAAMIQTVRGVGYRLAG
jgi:DNA-binding response OmpR family regulator